MRKSIVIGSALIIVIAGLGLMGCSNTSNKKSVEPVNVFIKVNPALAGSQPLSANMFAKFFEYNGCDAYPGIYADHLANGSFEIWNKSGNRTAVLYNNTKKYKGIAYPWEPVTNSPHVSYQQVPGGINGRKPEPDLDHGSEIIQAERPKPSGIKRPRYERISVKNGSGGVLQRTALPDHRTSSYIVKFSVRGKINGQFDVALTDQYGSVLAKKTVSVSRSWKRQKIKLHLKKLSTHRYQGSPFGEYALVFRVKGKGHVDLDWTMLMSGDAVDGMFNPTTIKLLKKFDVTGIRWPGGNFASQYHWKDGVGPLKNRPIVPNGNWGGFERNYLGTDEFLEFCKIAGIKPIITVASWSGISPKEIADWVQYVNGDASTKYGRLRARYGHPKPWNVKHWQIGNEVWGNYQIGHTDAKKYAGRYKKIYEAMKKADPDIIIDATGIDPYYTEYKDGSYKNRQPGVPPVWNKILFKNDASVVHGVDIHRYTRGLTTDKARLKWLKTNHSDPIGYDEAMVGFPTEYEQLLHGLRKEAAQYGIKDLRINVGEWNLSARVNKGWPRIDYPTMAHAVYMAGIFNDYIRLGHIVSYMRDNTLYYRPYPVDMRPLYPGLYTEKFYAEPFMNRDIIWHNLPVKVNSPTFTIPKTGLRIHKMKGVPYVDVASIISPKGRNVIVFAVNRNLKKTYKVAFNLQNKNSDNILKLKNGKVQVIIQTPIDNNPFKRQTSWKGPNSFVLKKESVNPDRNGIIHLKMPPASIVRMKLQIISGK